MDEENLVFDPVDDLILRLDAFHIGTSWRVVGAPEAKAEDKTASNDSDDEDSEEDDTSSDEGKWSSGDTQLSLVLHGLLPTAVALPIFIEKELGRLWTAQEKRNRKRYMVIPNPKAGCRPCWEPPILKYTVYEDIIKAHDIITLKEGRQDIGWRIELLDLTLEIALLGEYEEWVEGMVCDAETDEERCFYDGLFQEIKEDTEVVFDEEEVVIEKCGGDRVVDKYFNKLLKELNAIRLSRGSTPYPESSSSSLEATSLQNSRRSRPTGGIVEDI